MLGAEMLPTKMIEIKYVAKNDEKTDPILILPNGTILRTMTNDLNGQNDRQRTFYFLS